MTVRMLQRRGTASQWNSVGGSVVLQSGEVGVNTTNNTFKIGDGESVWTDLEYHYPDNLNELKYVQLAGGNAVSGNQVITGNVDINGLLKVTLDVDLDSDLAVAGSLSALDITTGVISSEEINVNGNKIVGLASPVSDTDAANKVYVDNLIAGLAWKEAAHLFATSNVAKTGSTGTLVIDGHDALVAADSGIYRIVLSAQTIPTENGIYLYTDNGTTYTLERTIDAITADQLHGASIYVQEGTTHGTSSWVQSNYAADTFDELVWVQFSGAALINAGSGMEKDGNTLNVRGTTNRILANDDSIDISPSYAGQTSISTLGNIEIGTWSASTIALNKGGTGATTASGARDNLQLGNVSVLNLGTSAGTVAEGNHIHDDRYYTETETDALLNGKVSNNSSPNFGLVTANNYNVTVSAEASNAVSLNFAAGTGLHTRTATGDVSVTASNYTAGATKTLFITCDSTSRNLTFPSSWIWVGSKPTSIAASKTGVLTVTSLGTAEANAVASWVAQV